LPENTKTIDKKKKKKLSKDKGKSKAMPLQAWTDPEGSRGLRLADFKTVGT